MVCKIRICCSCIKYYYSIEYINMSFMSRQFDTCRKAGVPEEVLKAWVPRHEYLRKLVGKYSVELKPNSRHLLTYLRCQYTLQNSPLFPKSVKTLLALTNGCSFTTPKGQKLNRVLLECFPDEEYYINRMAEYFKLPQKIDLVLSCTPVDVLLRGYVSEFRPNRAFNRKSDAWKDNGSCVRPYGSNGWTLLEDAKNSEIAVLMVKSSSGHIIARSTIRVGWSYNSTETSTLISGVWVNMNTYGNSHYDIRRIVKEHQIIPLATENSWVKKAGYMDGDPTAPTSIGRG